MKISEIITDKYKLRISPTVYYELLADVQEAEEKQRPVLDKIRAEIEQLSTTICTETRRIYIDADDFKENVLAIFDKYKAETEKT